MMVEQIAITGRVETFAGRDRTDTAHRWLVTLPRVQILVSFKGPPANRYWLDVSPLEPHRHTLTCYIHRGVTTGLTSPSFPNFAIEPMIFLRHVEVPEGVPLAVEVGGSEVQHRLRADGSQRIPVRSMRSLTRCRHAPSTTPLPIG